MKTRLLHIKLLAVANNQACGTRVRVRGTHYPVQIGAQNQTDFAKSVLSS